MRILVLNGSPRLEGNTKKMIDAFREGVQSKGHQIDVVDVCRKQIGGCIACEYCHTKGKGVCVQKDDMDKIYPVYKEADIIVLATPLYYWTISGQLKCAFDRLFAVAECDPNYRNPKKESVLLMAAEGHGFEETLYWYDRLEKHLGWKSIGKVLCGGVMAVGDIAEKPELQEAYELGKSIQ